MVHFQVVFSIMGVLNMLRGFFIFLVFICKPSVWKMVSKRFPKFVDLINRAKERCFRSASTSTSTTTAAAAFDDCSGEMTVRTRIEETTKFSIVIKRQEIIEETNC